MRNAGCGSHTHSHTSHIRANCIENRHHVPPLRHRTLKTGIEGVAREKGHQGRLLSIARIRSVVLYYRLETRDSSYRLRRTGPAVMAVSIPGAQIDRIEDAGNFKYHHTQYGRHHCNGATSNQGFPFGCSPTESTLKDADFPDACLICSSFRRSITMRGG